MITPEYPPQTGGVSDYARLVAEGLAAAGEEVHVWCPSLKAEETRAEGNQAGENQVDGVQADEIQVDKVQADGVQAGEVQAGVDEGDGRSDAALSSGVRGVGAQRGVRVHRELGSFAPSDLRRAGRLLDGYARPRRLLVQYVPHGYGYRAMNVPFCLWLWKRARVAGDRVELMVHEPFCAFGEGTLKQDAAALVHRLMTTILLRATRRVWTSIPAWEKLWRPYALGRSVEFGWLPVPSTVPVAADASRVASLRARYAPRADSMLVGHFGTYARHVAEQLAGLLPALLARNPSASALLIGSGGERLREELSRSQPSLGTRVHATGVLPPRELSSHLAACDLLVQPFPDGVSSRRTSVMAALAHGLPLVTNAGRLTEPLWAEGGAVKLVSAEGGEGATLWLAAVESLLSDAAARASLGRAARDFYRERFDAARVISELRRGAEAGDAPPDAVPARAEI